MVNAKAAVAAALQLLNDAHIDDALLNARLLFSYVTNKDYRLMAPNEQITAAEQRQLMQLCCRRAAHEPLQYLLGTWQFMNLELKVGEGVLIPRADSEDVCLAAIAKLKAQKAPVVYDLCAGTGALGLAIKEQIPAANVTAVELSPAAFSYLTANAVGKIQIIMHDIFTFQQTLQANSIDLIISNPPYIAAEEMPSLQAELAFEPKMALTDEQDGLSFYRHIANEYYPCVKPQGWIIFEIGYTQAQAVSQICKNAGWNNVEVENDCENRPRIVLAQK